MTELVTTLHNSSNGELKPCPFCGCEVDCRESIEGMMYCGWAIKGDHAEGCMMKILFAVGVSSKEGLISKWNRRVKE